MGTTANAFEAKIGMAPRGAAKRTQKYGARAPQEASRFEAKNPLARQALPDLGKDGA